MAQRGSRSATGLNSEPGSSCVLPTVWSKVVVGLLLLSWMMVLLCSAASGDRLNRNGGGLNGGYVFPRIASMA